MMGIAVSQTSIMLSHTLQFAVLLAIFTNLTQHVLYLCWQQRSRTSGHWSRFGPAYCVALATTLIMVHPSYLVLKVAKKVHPLEGVWGRTLHCCTIIGYVLLLVGTLWATSFWSKVRNLCG